MSAAAWSQTPEPPHIGHRRIMILVLVLAAVGVEPLLLPGSAVSAAPADPARVLVWAMPGEFEHGPGSRAGTVLARLGARQLVEVDAHRAAGLEPGRIADRQPWSAATYLVAGPASALQPPPAAVEVVSRGPGAWWLVRGEPVAVERLALRGMSLVALEPPARRAPAPRGAAPPPNAMLGAFDPAVGEMVLEISLEEITATLQRLQDFETRYSYSDSCAAAADYLAARFTALGLATELDPFDLSGTPASNVVATQVGTERPDEIFILCGHFDSISEQSMISAPGADDNGSGAAAVVEVARVLSAHAFESTIRYICFAGEEQGLRGSRHYVEDVIIDQGLTVRGVINLDMIAFVHPDYPDWDANIYADRVVSLWIGTHLGRCLGEYTLCADYVLPTDVPVWASDHFWFAEHGIPAAFAIDAQLWNAPDWNTYYHSSLDRIETLDLNYLTDFTRGAAAAMAELGVPVTGIGIADPSGAGDHRVSSVAAVPNPFAARVVFDRTGPHAGEALQVRIVDARGRFVAELSGFDAVTWDGRDATGARLPAGVYFYRIAGTARPADGRLVLIR